MGKTTEKLREDVQRTLENWSAAKKQKFNDYGLCPYDVSRDDPKYQKWEALIEHDTDNIGLSHKAYVEASKKLNEFLEKKAKSNKKFHSLKMKLKSILPGN